MRKLFAVIFVSAVVIGLFAITPVAGAVKDGRGPGASCGKFGGSFLTAGNGTLVEHFCPGGP